MQSEGHPVKALFQKGVNKSRPFGSLTPELLYNWLRLVVTFDSHIFPS